MKPEEQHNQTPVGPYSRSTPHRSWLITSMNSLPVMGESTSLSQTLLPLQKCVCGIKAVLKIFLPLPEYVLSGRYDCFYKLMASFTFGVHHLVWGLPRRPAPTTMKLQLFVATSTMEVQNMVHPDSMSSAFLGTLSKPEGD